MGNRKQHMSISGSPLSVTAAYTTKIRHISKSRLLTAMRFSIWVFRYPSRDVISVLLLLLIAEQSPPSNILYTLLVSFGQHWWLSSGIHFRQILLQLPLHLCFDELLLQLGLKHFLQENLNAANTCTKKITVEYVDFWNYNLHTCYYT